MRGVAGRINKRVCFALNLETGEQKKMFNMEEKQIFASIDKGDLGQRLRLEICSWASTSVVNQLLTVRTYCTSRMREERTTMKAKAQSQRKTE